ncbi:MAG: hypothetical protein HYZ08_02430, partial [Candidatus Kerfeldbacteria bacterium]|nr:hypothetical protein [Candidatus Kerfeldbacteria bacterium]
MSPFRRVLVVLLSIATIAVAVFEIVSLGRTADVSFTSSLIDGNLNDPYWIVTGDADVDGDVDIAL